MIRVYRRLISSHARVPSLILTPKNLLISTERDTSQVQTVIPVKLPIPHIPRGDEELKQETI